tara:strand:+ start:461 stop:2056 length:1596 start_codon:yes stop_codon:yes gene_type:complete
MSVPGSGELSLLKIAKEKVHDDYTSSSSITGTISLTDVSTSGDSNGSGESFDVTNTESPNFPDGSVSHGMSEFFSYDHDYSPIPCNKAMDVVFLLDYTASMSNYYTDSTNGLKAKIATISNKVVERSEGDYRLAAVLIDQNSSSPTYWTGNNTTVSNLSSANKYNSGTIYLAAMVPFANTNKSDFDTKIGYIAAGAAGSGNNSSTAMELGSGAGGPEPNDTAIDRVINHDLAGAFRSGVNKMVILVTDNAPDGDGDDSFNGEEEYLKMGTLSNNAVAENISISIIGSASDLTSTMNNITVGQYSSNSIYQSYADNTGGTANFNNNASSIVTQIENICDDIETNFPTVATNAESSVTSTGFTMNGNVTNQGGSAVTTRGFVRNTSNTSLFIGGSGVTNTTSGSGTGTFSSAVTGLSASTTYYYRAYAINSTGTAYGDIETVTTSAVSLTSFTASTSQTFSGVCSASANQTYYHNGSLARPIANDNVYTNSSGTSPLTAGYYRFDPLIGQFFRITGTAGLVASVDDCSELGGP